MEPYDLTRPVAMSSTKGDLEATRLFWAYIAGCEEFDWLNFDPEDRAKLMKEWGFGTMLNNTGLVHYSRVAAQIRDQKYPLGRLSETELVGHDWQYIDWPKDACKNETGIMIAVTWLACLVVNNDGKLAVIRKHVPDKGPLNKKWLCDSAFTRCPRYLRTIDGAGDLDIIVRDFFELSRLGIVLSAFNRLAPEEWLDAACRCRFAYFDGLAKEPDLVTLLAKSRGIPVNGGLVDSPIILLLRNEGFDEGRINRVVSSFEDL
jgi:hypothetical protein